MRTKANFLFRCVPIALIIWIIGTASVFPLPLLTNIVTNGDFESGDFNGWNTDGQLSIAAIGTDSVTDNSLQKVAEGKYSAMIGDDVPWMNTGPQQSSLDQTIQLPQTLTSSAVLEFAYAVVANDPPDHPEVDKPRFRVLVDDLTANNKLLDTEYLYTNQTSTDWYLGAGASNQIWNQPYYALASDRWVFRPWKLESISLAGLSGHQIRIHLEVRDCNYGAHAIYGFLDGVRVGSPVNMKLPDLQGHPMQAIYITPPFWAPILLWFERMGIIWLCCLLPLILLLLLLVLLISRSKRRDTGQPMTIHRNFKKADDKSSNLMGKQ